MRLPGLFGSQLGVLKLENMELDLQSGDVAPDSAVSDWIVAFREYYGVSTPSIEDTGRPDLVTERFAIKVVRFAAWKQGLGLVQTPLPLIEEKSLCWPSYGPQIGRTTKQLSTLAICARNTSGRWVSGSLF